MRQVQYNPRELLARIRTVLRRCKGGEGGDGREPGESAAKDTDVRVFHFAEWRLDTGARLLIHPAGQAMALTDGEFRLMRAFAEHPHRSQ